MSTLFSSAMSWFALAAGITAGNPAARPQSWSIAGPLAANGGLWAPAAGNSRIIAARGRVSVLSRRAGIYGRTWARAAGWGKIVAAPGQLSRKYGRGGPVRGKWGDPPLAELLGKTLPHNENQNALFSLVITRMTTSIR